MKSCLAGFGLLVLAHVTHAAELTLTDCLRQTLEKNPDIQLRQADVERATGTKLIYRTRALPRLHTTVQGGVRQGTLYDPDGPFSILTARLAQPLFDAGIPPAYRRAGLEVVIAQQTLHHTVTERLHGARVTFLRALYLRDVTTLYAELATRLQANVDREQQRRDVGAGTAAALAWAKIQLLHHNRELTNLRAEYFHAQTRLAELTGRDLTTAAGNIQIPQPAGDLEFDPAPVDWPAETTAALAHRADLKLLQTLAEAAAAERQTVQAGYWPLVQLVASTLFIPESALLSEHTDVVAGQESRSTEWRAGLALSWRVIDDGQVTGAARRLAARREIYEITRRQLAQNIPRELAVVAGALESTAARRAALQQSVASATENLQLIETRVALGEATQFDFLKAQANLLAVRAGLADATHAHAIARASLDRVTGRYLQFTP